MSNVNFVLGSLGKGSELRHLFASMELDRSHPVRNFFAIDKVSNKSKCLIDSSCRRHVRPMTGNHSGNLLRHVKRWHVNEYGEIVQLLKSAALKRKRTDEDDKVVKRFNRSGDFDWRFNRSMAGRKNVDAFLLPT
jgi:hypothetical protein